MENVHVNVVGLFVTAPVSSDVALVFGRFRQVTPATVWGFRKPDKACQYFSSALDQVH